MDILRKDTQRNTENTLPEYEIGVRHNDLSSLKENLSQAGGSCSYEIMNEKSGREMIRITDAYGRIFVARESKHIENFCTEKPTVSSICQQRVICSSAEDTSQYGTNIVEKYGTARQPICQGMDYIEFFVSGHEDDNGRTKEKIAKFYDFFFGATTAVAHDGTSHVAIIGFGKIDDDGRAISFVSGEAVRQLTKCWRCCQ
mmetsp:Transcript_44599/g.94904  ORF Transcript_44599/g.94904 Transcript_44599/m.94904 type:complete len:200 (-) Transcript_44599:223-822(-)